MYIGILYKTKIYSYAIGSFYMKNGIWLVYLLAGKKEKRYK